jgi:hypothetical protein
MEPFYIPGRDMEPEIHTVCVNFDLGKPGYRPRVFIVTVIAEFFEHGFNLENAVGSPKSAQAIDSSSYMKKVLITNEVTTHFFITLSKSIDCTSFSRPTAFSRFELAS